MIKSNIRELMESNGYSIRRLAAHTQLSVQTIQRARDKSITECKLSTLNTIAKALRQPISSLFDEESQA